jgi:hypothetical protein
MMGANALELGAVGALAGAVPRDRRYLHALATIEQIAGFEHTAKSYAEAARSIVPDAPETVHQRADLSSSPSGAAVPILLRAPRSPRGTRPEMVGTALPLPFKRSALVDGVGDSQGNYVERRTLALESLPVRADTLGYLYRYWRDLRTQTNCGFNDVDSVHLARAGIIGKLHILNVTSSDPAEFRYELFGYAVPVPQYPTPKAHPIGIWVDSLLRDYNTVRLSGVPRLHRVRSRLNGTSYHYTRLILPFLDKRHRVNRLAVAIRQEPGDGVNAEAGQEFFAAHID